MAVSRKAWMILVSPLLVVGLAICAVLVVQSRRAPLTPLGRGTDSPRTWVRVSDPYLIWRVREQVAKLPPIFGKHEIGDIDGDGVADAIEVVRAKQRNRLTIRARLSASSPQDAFKQIYSIQQVAIDRSASRKGFVFERSFFKLDTRSRRVVFSDEQVIAHQPLDRLSVWFVDMDGKPVLAVGFDKPKLDDGLTDVMMLHRSVPKDVVNIGGRVLWPGRYKGDLELEIATFWAVPWADAERSGMMAHSDSNVIRSDSDGFFSGQVTLTKGKEWQPVTLTAITSDRRYGGVYFFDNANLGSLDPKQLTIKLFRLVTVSGTLDRSKLEMLPDQAASDRGARITITKSGGPPFHPIVGFGLERETFSCKLPPGEYTIWIDADNAKRTIFDFRIRPNEISKNLGKIVLSLAKLVQNFHDGDSMPSLTITEALIDGKLIRGASGASALAPFLAREFVIYYFFTEWCAPCLAETGLPRALRFYREASKRYGERLAIVAVHSDFLGASKSDGIEAFAEKIGRLPQTTLRLEHFSTAKIPLIWDSSGASAKALGIEAYPTVIATFQGRIVKVSEIGNQSETVYGWVQRQLKSGSVESN